MQLVSEGSRHVLKLDDGADVFQSLSKFATTGGHRAAVLVSGIGQFREATIGFWNGAEYVPETLRTPQELVGLHGSIAEVDGAPSVHLHATLTDSHHLARGGHLLKATVGIVAELYLETFPGRAFGRPFRETLGLRTLDLEPGPSP